MDAKGSYEDVGDPCDHKEEKAREVSAFSFFGRDETEPVEVCLHCFAKKA